MSQGDPIPQADDKPRPLTGRLDRADRKAVTGWALEPFAPQIRVALVVKANGEIIGRVVADQHRPDLEHAGKGDGRCSFRFIALKALAPDVEYRIEVCRESDDRALPGCPIVIPAVGMPRSVPKPVPAAPPPPPQEALGALAG